MKLLDRLDKALRKREIILTCEACGHTGTTVRETPTYSPVLGRDTTAYLCTDITTCLTRSGRKPTRSGRKPKTESCGIYLPTQKTAIRYGDKGVDHA